MTRVPANWAEELAATLPPLPPDEAAQIGLIAARLDARGATSGPPDSPQIPEPDVDA